jgi:predicted RNase H-like nuclease (RuvC/YqgF family)
MHDNYTGNRESHGLAERNEVLTKKLNEAQKRIEELEAKPVEKVSKSDLEKQLSEAERVMRDIIGKDPDDLSGVMGYLMKYYPMRKK